MRQRANFPIFSLKSAELPEETGRFRRPVRLAANFESSELEPRPQRCEVVEAAPDLPCDGSFERGGATEIMHEEKVS
jgi:hypothetical protein